MQKICFASYYIRVTLDLGQTKAYGARTSFPALRTSKSRFSPKVQRVANVYAYHLCGIFESKKFGTKCQVDLWL